MSQMKVGDYVERVYTVPGDPPSVVYGEVGTVHEIDRSHFVYVKYQWGINGPYAEGQLRVVKRV